MDFSKVTKYLNPAEKIFVTLSLLHYSAAVLPVLIMGGASEGDGIDISTFNFSLNNYVFILNYLIVFVLLTLRWKKAIQILTGNYLFILLILLLPVSYLWSAKPDETLSGSIGMIGTLLFGIYIASRFSLKEQLQLICWSFGLSIVLCLIFIVFLPKYGIMGGVHAGIIRGVYTHKNQLGKAMILGSTMFLIYAKSCGNRNIYAWLGLIASTALILGSMSTSSLLNGSVLAIIVLSSHIFKLKTKYFLLSIFFLAAAIFALSNWSLSIAEAVVELFGKDLTLTGRADIWPYAIDKIQERPWLGYGFNGFWHGKEGESLFMIFAMRWKVPNSHNGFLDLILDLGLVGFSVFILLLWTLLIKNMFLLRRNFSWLYVWPFSYLIYTIIINLTETSLISQNNLGWLLFIVVSLSISKEFKLLTTSASPPFMSPMPLSSLQSSESSG